MKKTAVIWDERFTRHVMGLGHPESPSRLFAIKEVLDGNGVGREVVCAKPREASKEELAYIHDESYIESVEKTNGQEPVYLDPDTVACSATWMAAKLAAGSTLSLIEKVVKGDFKNGFAFVRPPGHHAERNRAMGFCFFNNIAIGARYAVKDLELERVAIVDFDVHHGNGTQNAFYEDDRVFFTSVHRSNFYPGTGLESESGSGKGKGTTLNIPLEYGADDNVYKKVFDERIMPAVEHFKPQLILVSAGFDPHYRDPLGGMKMTTAGFQWIAVHLAELAKECCEGKHVYVLEGGYDLRAIRECTEKILEAMVAAKTV
jgi:acetoin utilization deacetylase AcuC-like enzyme